MKIVVDAAKCQGHGRCAALAPDLFELDDVGHCAIDTLEIDASQVEAARRGVFACPELAIALIDDEPVDGET